MFDPEVFSEKMFNLGQRNLQQQITLHLSKNNKKPQKITGDKYQSRILVIIR